MTAGLGTRLKPLTDVLPKPMVPVFNIPLLQFIAEQAALTGIDRMVFNTHHLSQRFKAEMNGLILDAVQVVVSDEEKVLLGSGGGVRQAADFIQGERFILLNGDCFAPLDLAALVRAHIKNQLRYGAVLTLAIHTNREPYLRNGSYREIKLDPSGNRIEGLGEVVSAGPFYMGAAVVEKEWILKQMPEVGIGEFVPSFLKPAIASHKAGAFLVNSLWCDIGSPALWMETHFELMDWLEQGLIGQDKFTRKAKEIFGKRVASCNTRRSSLCWESHTNLWQPEYFPKYTYLNCGQPGSGRIVERVVGYGIPPRRDRLESIAFWNGWTFDGNIPSQF